MQSNITICEDPEGLSLRKGEKIVSSRSVFIANLVLLAFIGLVCLALFAGVFFGPETDGLFWWNVILFVFILLPGLILMCLVGVRLWKLRQILRKWVVVKILPDKIQFIQDNDILLMEIPMQSIERIVLFRYEITSKQKYMTYLLGYTLNLKIRLHDGTIIHSGDIFSSRKSAPLYRTMKLIRSKLESQQIIDVERYFKFERKITRPTFFRLKVR